MKEETDLRLWRLVKNISVEDAAILIAGGDPNATDMEESSWSYEPFKVKRTTGHKGFLPAFEALKDAIRNGELKASFAHQADYTDGYSKEIDGETWAYLTTDITDMKLTIEEHAFNYVQPPKGETVQISVEPDWTRTSVDVEDLKAWLRSRGFRDGFFLSDTDADEDEDSGEAFMDVKHDHFAPELALAVSAWRALEGSTVVNRSPKAAIQGWIDANPNSWHGPGELSGSAKERIVTLVNWKREGGAPKSKG